MLKAYSRLQARINSVRTEEEGATAVEYGLIIALVSILIVGALALLTPGIIEAINGVVAQLPAGE